MEPSRRQSPGSYPWLILQMPASNIAACSKGTTKHRYMRSKISFQTQKDISSWSHPSSDYLTNQDVILERFMVLTVECICTCRPKSTARLVKQVHQILLTPSMWRTKGMQVLDLELALVTLTRLHLLCMISLAAVYVSVDFQICFHFFLLVALRDFQVFLHNWWRAYYLIWLRWIQDEFHEGE